ncbi:MAG: sugar phosphate isomerase/epimerase family protein [Flavobacteriaceae bacterium]
MKRRNFITTTTAGACALSFPALTSFEGWPAELRFGVAEASYLIRWYKRLESSSYPPFKTAMEMINHCGELGFGGIQVGIRNWDKDFSRKLRKRSEELAMFLEGQIKLPSDEQDVARFKADLLGAKEAGITIVRTACLSGRRYETFDSLTEFKKFKSASMKSIALAAPLLKKHEMKLAIENHKDWRVAEFLEILNTIGSEWVGITLDTGNNISLLEDPMEVVTALAPYAFSVHLKDMAVAEYDDGFLLSEVNLGEGFLDIKKMIRLIKKQNPDIRFNLEMITRDPLKVPCLTEKYWATFEQISAADLGRFLRKIREQKAKEALPRVSDKGSDAQLKLEIDNNRTSLNYAKQHLGFN